MNERLSGVRTVDWSKVKKLFNYHFERVTGGMPNDVQRRLIARNYSTVQDQITDGIGDWNGIDPYQIADWLRVLTEPEFGAWQGIRSCGLPLWPRLPVGGCVVSFGNPQAKVALQCDDSDESLRIDHWLKQTGWRVFRATAAQCTRVMESPADLHERTGEVSDAYRARYQAETLAGTMQDLRHALIAAGASL